MSTFTDTSFLCSYFSYDQQRDIDSILSGAGWKRLVFDDDLIRTYKNFFYPEFVDYSLGNPDDKGSVSVYSKVVEAVVDIYGFSVLLKNLRIHVMPYGMMIFAIHVEMESDSLDDFTLALFNMRERRKWDAPELQAFHEKGLLPVEEAALLSGSENGEVIEMGNKLKVFQIVNTEERKNYAENMDFTLFELGTLGKIGGCSANDPNSPSKSYIDHVIKDNRLSFFNNWTGLALFDSFTIMAYKATPWMIDTWISDYFSMIYIHNLFMKFYLFRLNYRFRTHPEDGKRLEDEYKQFERKYTFNKISYNFLPGEINKAMDRGLEISEEKQLLVSYISGYNKEKDEEDSRRLDRILTFLAVVTVFSTIWDFSSMLNAMWPFENFSLSVAAGFRMVVMLTLLAVILVIIAIIKKPQKFK
ncbi:MAG: hypothetical protein K2H72_06535 [Muribaculaceae bacterium]|nr:hypothetical protein [Muribaculaceae bacterium]